MLADGLDALIRFDKISKPTKISQQLRGAAYKSEMFFKTH
jgi:hypothetical protein